MPDIASMHADKVASVQTYMSRDSKGKLCCPILTWNGLDLMCSVGQMVRMKELSTGGFVEVMDLTAVVTEDRFIQSKADTRPQNGDTILYTPRPEADRIALRITSADKLSGGTLWRFKMESPHKGA